MLMTNAIKTERPIVSDEFYACPKCGNRELYFKQFYCDCCGQKLVWKDEDYVNRRTMHERKEVETIKRLVAEELNSKGVTS